MLEEERKLQKIFQPSKKSSLLEKNTRRTCDPTKYEKNSIFKIPADTDFELRPWKAHL